MPFAVLALTGFGTLVVIVASALGKPRILHFGAAAGIAAAILLWVLVPRSVWDRMF